VKGLQPSVDIGCGSSTEEDNCVLSFICTETLGRETAQMLMIFFALLIKFSICSKWKSIFSDLLQRAAMVMENEGAVAKLSKQSEQSYFYI